MSTLKITDRTVLLDGVDISRSVALDSITITPSAGGRWEVDIPLVVTDLEVDLSDVETVDPTPCDHQIQYACGTCVGMKADR